MNFLRRLANNRNPNSLANKFRRARGKLLSAELNKLSRPAKLLDVGGTESFWRDSRIDNLDGFEVLLLNLETEPVSLPNFSSLAGDAKNLSQFPDKNFDLVVSNSVIEHVGGYEDQALMAQELIRVGKRVFVQTPARHFPIEPHFLFPFFALLPLSLRVWLIRHFALGWYPQVPDPQEAREFLRFFRPLNHKEMRGFFPGFALRKERFLGLTKSYVVSGAGEDEPS